MNKKTLIAIPAVDMCPTAFAYSLATLRRDGPAGISIVAGAAVHEARNKLAAEAIAEGCDRVLWLDSDMVFPDDTLIRLGEDLDQGWDMVCGLYTKRQLPATPVVYKAIDPEAGRAEVYADYPEDSLFPIAGCGFGVVLMKAELLADPEPFTPLPRLSEDLSFCWRASRHGARMACDSRIRIGHAGQMIYSPAMYKRPNA